MPPTVSVIIPTYNYSNVLRCAIESVLLQTLQDFELIVVGDGCTDDSEDVVKSFDDPRVQWHNLPQNYGNQGPANRTGLEMARGEYIAYLGHDDLWLRDHLDIALNALRQAGKPLGVTLRMAIGPEDVGWRYIDHIGVLEYVESRHVTPGQMIHTRELGQSASWRSLKELESVGRLNTEVAFLRDCQEATGPDGFLAIQQLTVLKFPAYWRKDVYKDRPSHEQEYYLERIRTEPGLQEALLLETLHSAEQGLFYKPLSKMTGKRPQTPSEHWGTVRRWQGLTAGEGTVAEASEATDYVVLEGENLLGEYTHRINKLTQVAARRKKKMRRLGKRLKKLQATVETLQAEQSNLQAQLAESDGRVNQLKQFNLRKKRRLRKLSQQIDTLNSTVQTLETTQSSLQAQIAKSAEQISQLEQTKSDQAQTIAAFDERVSTLQSKVQTLKERQGVLRAQRSQANQKVQSLKAQKDQLEDEITAIHSTRAWRWLNGFWAFKNRLLPRRP